MKPILIMLLSLFSSQTFAQAKVEGVLNQLLAPGPMILGHENLEHKQCLKCHEVGGGIPDKNCLKCHKEIAAHKRKKAHFHGLHKKDCISCHKDHKGRNFNSLAFNHKTFDHKATGYRLDGGHRNVECKDCHTTRRSQKPIRKNEIRFFGTSTSCKSCHAKDDIHFFPEKWARKECSSCHNTNTWNDAKTFDHRKETGFALQGQHAKMTCEKCHAPKGKGSQKYSWPNLKRDACLSCHRDHHKANLKPRFRGGNCARCHNQNQWKINPFKHSVTGFWFEGCTFES